MFFFRAGAVVVFVAISAAGLAAQDSKSTEKPADAQVAAAERSGAQEAHSAPAYSGIYSFLKDGEFVQVTVEDEGKVTGFISRYEEGGGEKGTFLDQYFRSAKLEGNKLSFTTETAHGVWFEFKGTVERGEGKKSGDEAYYVLKGTLTDSSSDAQKKVTSHSHEVAFSMFPKEASRN